MIETDRQEVVREDRQKVVLERDIAVVNRADHHACNIFGCDIVRRICYVDPLISIAREREREREREEEEIKMFVIARIPLLRTKK